MQNTNGWKWRWAAWEALGGEGRWLQDGDAKWKEKAVNLSTLKKRAAAIHYKACFHAHELCVCVCGSSGALPVRTRPPPVTVYYNV